MSRIGLFLLRVTLFGGGMELLDMWLDNDTFHVGTALVVGVVFAAVLAVADVARDRWDGGRMRRPPAS
jgi:hypothetical protein